MAGEEMHKSAVVFGARGAITRYGYGVGYLRTYDSLLVRVYVPVGTTDGTMTFTADGWL